MNDWLNQSCQKRVTPMPIEEVKMALRQISGWTLGKDSKSITSSWKMRDFSAAINLVNEVAKIAENEDHHPDFHLQGYRNITIELSTHSVSGISINDVILASKVNKIPKDLF